MTPASRAAWRDHSRSLEEVGLVRPGSHILTGLGAAEQISGGP
jgi:hypothetical protein